MPKATQQTDIRDRLWVASNTLALHHCTTWIENDLAPMTGKALQKKDMKGTCQTFWEERQTQAPTSRGYN